MNAIQSAVAAGELLPSDVCPHLLDGCMYTAAGGSGGAAGSLGAGGSTSGTGGCPPVDLVIRTSGETRLSDYLLWQSRGAQLEFIDRCER